MPLDCADLGAGLRCTCRLPLGQWDGPSSKGCPPTQTAMPTATPCPFCPLCLPCSLGAAYVAGGWWLPLLLAVPTPRQLLLCELLAPGGSLCSPGASPAQETPLYTTIPSSTVEPICTRADHLSEFIYLRMARRLHSNLSSM